MAWLSLGLPLAASLAAAVLCYRSRRYFGALHSPAQRAGGVIGLLSGAALVISGVLQAGGGAGLLGAGSYNAAAQGVIRVAFWVSCLLFGLVQIAGSVGFFTGKNSLGKAPLLYLAGALWGVCYLVLVYVFYAKSSSFVENFFAVVGAAALLLALFYLCKLLAGVEEESAARRLFIAGSFGVVLTVSYTFSNLALMPLGRWYTGEIPAVIQIPALGVALFLLLFLVTFRRYSLRPTPRGARRAPPPATGPDAGRPPQKGTGKTIKSFWSSFFQKACEVWSGAPRP